MHTHAGNVAIVFPRSNDYCVNIIVCLFGIYLFYFFLSFSFRLMDCNYINRRERETHTHTDMRRLRLCTSLPPQSHGSVGPCLSAKADSNRFMDETEKISIRDGGGKNMTKWKFQNFVFLWTHIFSKNSWKTLCIFYWT